MTIGTTRSDSGFPKIASVADMKEMDLQLGLVVETIAYLSNWSATNSEPTGGGIYNIVTVSNYLAITGLASVNETTDHTLDNGSVAMLQRDGVKTNTQAGTAGVINQTIAGLNPTFSVWDSALNVFEVGGNSALSSELAVGTGSGLLSMQNAHYDGAWKYISEDEASYSYQSGGNHVHLSTVSGSAASTISWTEISRMGLSASGANVLSVGKSTIAPFQGIYSVLQIGNESALMSNTAPGAGNQFYQMNNAYLSTDGWKYSSTDEATLYRSVDGAHSFFSAPSGSATNSISWTEISRMGLSSSNSSPILSVGRATIDDWGSGRPAIQLGGNCTLMSSTGPGGLNIQNNAYFNGSTWKYISTNAAAQYQVSPGLHVWYAANSGSAGADLTWTESMRIDSDGRLSIGKTNPSSGVAGVTIFEDGRVNMTRAGYTLNLNRLTSAGVTAQFLYIGGIVGNISVASGTTTFNSTSDYRLKENVSDLTDGLSNVNLLKPKRFNFINDEEKAVMDGFLAHEVVSILPMAVQGQKDLLDEDGEIDPQSMDASKLIPMMVSAIQEMSREITDLKSKMRH